MFLNDSSSPCCELEKSEIWKIFLRRIHISRTEKDANAMART